jgi:hypothetical protein
LASEETLKFTYHNPDQETWPSSSSVSSSIGLDEDAILPPLSAMIISATVEIRMTQLIFATIMDHLSLILMQLYRLLPAG